MSSKSRGGLSKREYAAKISTPVKKTTSKVSGASSSSGVPDYVSMINDTYNANRNGTRASQIVTPAKMEAMKKQPKYSSSKSSNKSSNYSSGKSFSENVNDYNNSQTIKNAQLTPIKTRSGLGSDLFRGATNVVKAIVPGGQALSDLFDASGMDVSNYLGIDKALASDSGLSNYVDDRGKVLGASDQNKAYDYNNPSPVTPTSILNRNQGPINVSPTNSNQNNSNDRRPSPVSNPYNIPQQTNALQDIIKSLIEYRPDETPTQSSQGTVRRPVGMGEFSSGKFSNGAGGYNLGGGGSVMGGGEGNSNNIMDESWINKIFGIQTANAAPASFKDPVNIAGYDAAQSEYDQLQAEADRLSGELGMGYGGDNQGIADSPGTTDHVSRINKEYYANKYGTGNSGYDSTNQVDQPNLQQGSGIVPQFSQGSAGGQKFDNSGFKAQEKAQKKALNELIKSIKSQYAQSTTEGTTALDSAKQQDLLKLSGLFNFGANQDPNTEQRLQYEQRTAGDYAGQLKDFLNKLAQGQAKDISGANQGYQSSLAQIMQQQQQAKQAYQQQMQDLQRQQEQQQWDRNYKMMALNRTKNTPKKTWTDPATGDIYEEQ